jgi:hypothetical protein
MVEMENCLKMKAPPPPIEKIDPPVDKTLKQGGPPYSTKVEADNRVDGGGGFMQARWLPWAVGGTGLALGATGGVFYLSARSTFDDLMASCGVRCEKSKIDSGRRKEIVGFSMMAVGGLALAGSVAILVMQGDENESQNKTAVVPTTNGLAVFGTF